MAEDPDLDDADDLDDVGQEPDDGLGPLPAEPESSRGPQARQQLARRIALNLRDAINLVGIDEFYSQEAQFDQDSRLGRELLYLIANDEWSRATRETVSLESSDSVATTIQVHVDLGRITHEAFRNRTERVWLPLVVLPPPTAEPGEQEPRGGPRVAPTPLVRDHTQTIVPPLPQSEARRWMAAAMAEIILNITPAAMGDASAQSQARTLGREQRLLLSAAIYRVLRQGSDTVRERSGQWVAQTHIDDGYRQGRIQQARRLLTTMLADVAERLAPQHEADRSTLLIRRAARVLHAVSSPSTLVVVSVEPEAESRLFIVDVPARPLEGVRRPFSAPRAQVQLNVLLPAVDADRAIVINLPEGLSFAQPDKRGEGQPVRARFKVDRPRIEWQIDNLLDQLAPADGELWPDPVARSTVDFVLARMDVARDSYRVYRATPQDAEKRGTLPDRLPRSVARLQRALQRIRSGPLVEDPVTGVSPARQAQRAVRHHRRQPPAQLYRAHEGDAISPRRAHIRVPAVENRNVRGTPVEATVVLEIVADNSTPLRAARNSGLMSILLLLSVLVLARWLGDAQDFSDSGNRQVLASVLTLFAVLQAGRIQIPDRSTLRGLLDTGGSWVIVTSVLPPVLLGVGLAFSQFSESAIVAAIVIQVLLQVAMYTPPVTGRAWRRRRRPRLRLQTEREPPDYARIDVLHSSWWRSTTAAALLLGASAHGYLLHQKEEGGVEEFLGGDEAEAIPMPRSASPMIERVRRNVQRRMPVLRSPFRNGDPPHEHASPIGDVPADPGPEPDLTPANVLAMLRAGSAAQALTFLVFREELAAQWQQQTGAQPVDLDVDRLIAHEAPLGHLDVFIGLPPERLHALATHPVLTLLELARERQLLIIDVQFPSPPPLGACAARSWTRTRFGVRGDEVSGLSALLADVRTRVQAAARRTRTPIDLLVDTSTQTPPRRFLGSPAGDDDQLPDDAGLAPMPPSALDWMGAATRSVPDAGHEWLMMCFSQYAGSGAEAQLVTAIITRYPTLELAGLTVGILHGTCVVFALGRVEAGSAPVQAQEPGEARLLHESRTTRKDLGRLDDDGLLLLVQAQYSDRPGLFIALVEALSEGLARAGGHRFDARDVHLTYIHTEVADGRNATTWFIVVLPPAAVYEQYDRLTLDQIERDGRRVLSQVAADDPAADGLGLLHAAKAMVSIEVITVLPESTDVYLDLDAATATGPDVPAATPPFQE